jgi:hypothetical protein
MTQPISAVPSSGSAALKLKEEERRAGAYLSIAEIGERIGQISYGREEYGRRVLDPAISSYQTALRLMEAYAPAHPLKGEIEANLENAQNLKKNIPNYTFKF